MPDLNEEPGLDPSVPLIERPSTRLLILDETGSVLLFRASTPAGMWLWFPPGGGLEPGESYEDAGTRELWEETGQRVPLGPHVWTRDATRQCPGRSTVARCASTASSTSTRTSHFDPDP